MTMFWMNRTSRPGSFGRSVGRSIGGFTLIELMIVVLIIGVLMAIAYPAYQNHVIKTRRAAASACMLEASQFMERFYTTNLRYDEESGTGTAVALPPLQCAQDISIHYAIGIAAAAPNTYSISATPQGQQLGRDTKCGTLTVTQSGVRTESGSGTVAECW